MRLRRMLVDNFEFLLPRHALRRRVARRTSPGSRADLHSLLTYCGTRTWADRSAVDVGANSGLFSFPLGQIFSEVLAIEPNLERARYLERALPSAIRVICAACGEEPAVADLHIPLAPGGSPLHSLGSLHKRGLDEFGGAAGEIRHVLTPVITIDALEPFLRNPPGLIKIDVEGHELSVLHGAQAVLERHRPHLYVEIERRHGAEPEELYRLLDGYGYGCHAVRRGELVACRDLSTFERALSDDRVINYLFIPPNRFASPAERADSRFRRAVSPPGTEAEPPG